MNLFLFRFNGIIGKFIYENLTKMKSPFYLCLLFILLSNSFLFAQDAKYQKIHPFDLNKFNLKIQEQNPPGLDQLLKILPDTALISSRNQNDMPVLDSQNGQISFMPTMPIRTDINYTMPIKKYDLSYPYVPEERIDSILNFRNKKNIPLNLE